MGTQFNRAWLSSRRQAPRAGRPAPGAASVARDETAGGAALRCRRWFANTWAVPAGEVYTLILCSTSRARRRVSRGVADSGALGNLALLRNAIRRAMKARAGEAPVRFAAADRRGRVSRFRARSRSSSAAIGARGSRWRLRSSGSALFEDGASPSASPVACFALLAVAAAFHSPLANVFGDGVFGAAAILVFTMRPRVAGDPLRYPRLAPRRRAAPAGRRRFCAAFFDARHLTAAPIQFTLCTFDQGVAHPSFERAVVVERKGGWFFRYTRANEDIDMQLDVGGQAFQQLVVGAEQ